MSIPPATEPPPPPGSHWAGTACQGVPAWGAVRSLGWGTVRGVATCPPGLGNEIWVGLVNKPLLCKLPQWQLDNCLTKQRNTLCFLLTPFTHSSKIVLLYLFNRYINTLKIKPPQRIKTFEELPIKETLVFNVSNSWAPNSTPFISFYLCDRFIQRESSWGLLLCLLHW